MFALNDKELQTLPVGLAPFQILEGEAPNTVFSMKGKELLTSNLHEFLNMMGPAINSPHLKVTGSLFLKRYALYMASLYVMSSEDCVLPIDFGDFQMSIQGTQFLFHFPSLVIKPRVGNRNEWRMQVLHHIFRDHLTPLIQNIVEQTKVFPQTLWSHVSFYIAYSYEKWIQETTDIVKKNRLLDDYQTLRELKAELFGMNENPLSQPIERFEHSALQGETIPIRSKCCFNFCLSSRKACYTCPKLSDEERISLYIEDTYKYRRSDQ
ncbi:IucA/IucC family C-terminal-domain containing protein [Risungbinella massiliensis]|uniref:IucA/IucC family C-terminal-domain containing protein n=1 Tax=Risungbinella massiliensis TaxID=1329796 RepID=UPI0005CB9F7C|nr:IucA/IucC family C-terminal-domain containing protein [Risungbinella massiliensis]